MEENVVEFQIAGCLYTGDKPLSIDELSDAFIDFVESKDWKFCGTTMPLEDDDFKVGDKVICIITNSPTLAPCEVCTITDIKLNFLKLEGYSTVFNKRMFRKY